MFDVEFYETADGRIPVEDFLESLPPRLWEKSIFALNMLEMFGSTLREPYSKNLGDGLFELRIKYSSDIARMFYFFYVGKKIIVTNGFIKKSMKTPTGERKKAEKYKKDYLKKAGKNNV